jgi:hypothetical protein
MTIEMVVPTMVMETSNIKERKKKSKSRGIGQWVSQPVQSLQIKERKKEKKQAQGSHSQPVNYSTHLSLTLFLVADPRGHTTIDSTVPYLSCADC